MRPGIINVDFADVRSVMGNAGSALMGIGSGTGKGRAALAASRAISSPLLDAPIERATGIVFNVIGGSDMSLKEIQDAADLIYGSVDVDANVIFGALVDDSIEDDSITITVLATGFRVEGEAVPIREGEERRARRAARPPRLKGWYLMAVFNLKSKIQPL